MASIVLKNVSDELHYELKVHAAETGVTMRALILETLAAAVAKPARKKR
jgi:plasmid stability protein